MSSSSYRADSSSNSPRLESSSVGSISTSDIGDKQLLERSDAMLGGMSYYNIRERSFPPPMGRKIITLVVELSNVLEDEMAHSRELKSSYSGLTSTMLALAKRCARFDILYGRLQDTYEREGKNLEESNGLRWKLSKELADALDENVKLQERLDYWNEGLGQETERSNACLELLQKHVKLSPPTSRDPQEFRFYIEECDRILSLTPQQRHDEREEADLEAKLNLATANRTQFTGNALMLRPGTPSTRSSTSGSSGVQNSALLPSRLKLFPGVGSYPSALALLHPKIPPLRQISTSNSVSIANSDAAIKPIHDNATNHAANKRSSLEASQNLDAKIRMHRAQDALEARSTSRAVREIEQQLRSDFEGLLRVNLDDGRFVRLSGPISQPSTSSSAVAPPPPDVKEEEFSPKLSAFQGLAVLNPDSADEEVDYDEQQRIVNGLTTVLSRYISEKEVQALEETSADELAQEFASEHDGATFSPLYSLYSTLQTASGRPLMTRELSPEYLPVAPPSRHVFTDATATVHTRGNLWRIPAKRARVDEFDDSDNDGDDESPRKRRKLEDLPTDVETGSHHHNSPSSSSPKRKMLPGQSRHYRSNIHDLCNELHIERVWSSDDELQASWTPVVNVRQLQRNSSEIDELAGDMSGEEEEGVQEESSSDELGLGAEPEDQERGENIEDDTLLRSNLDIAIWGDGSPLATSPEGRPTNGVIRRSRSRPSQSVSPLQSPQKIRPLSASF